MLHIYVTFNMYMYTDKVILCYLYTNILYIYITLSYLFNIYVIYILGNKQFLRKKETLSSRNSSTLIHTEIDNHLIRKINSCENQQIFRFV